jgi:hypothetical protein
LRDLHSDKDVYCALSKSKLDVRGLFEGGEDPIPHRAFRRTEVETFLHHWHPRPHDDAAHKALLRFLGRLVGKAFFASMTDLPEPVKGNLGEFVSYFVGRKCGGCMAYQFQFPTNALMPLTHASTPGIDCIWLHVGGRPADDWIIVQEVKTASTEDCAHARHLEDDFERLIAPDTTSLAVRLRSLKNVLEFGWRKPGLAARLNKFIEPKVEKFVNTIALPTLVFDHVRATEDTATARISVVRDALISKGWLPGRVQAWVIGFGDLESRFIRLAMGRA